MIIGISDKESNGRHPRRLERDVDDIRLVIGIFVRVLGDACGGASGVGRALDIVSIEHIAVGAREFGRWNAVKPV